MDVSNYEKITMDKRENGLYTYMQDRQENFWAPGAKGNLPPSSNSPTNDTQTKSTTVCHKQGISTTKMN
jgi:hypothetical protein